MASFEIEKFDGKTDFDVWKAKIKAILGQQKAIKAIEDPAKLPTTMTKETIWKNLNEIYLSKDLPNKAYLREKLFIYKMDLTKILSKNLDDFKCLAAKFKRKHHHMCYYLSSKNLST